MILRAAGWRQTTPGSEDHPSKSQVAEFHCGENILCEFSLWRTITLWNSTSMNRTLWKLTEVELHSAKTPLHANRQNKRKNGVIVGGERVPTLLVR